ncbi:MAG: hypothetical protein AAB834_00680, partial [Patescibacteria group bacterium]
DAQEIKKEQEADGARPRDVAPNLIAGLLLSEEFVGHTRPFTSLGDERIRDSFRAIADTMIEGTGELQPGVDPLTLSRAALRRPLPYDDVERDWDRDEVYGQLTMAFAERGHTFGDSEHMDKSSPALSWPANAARLLRMSLDLGRGVIEDEARQRA